MTKFRTRILVSLPAVLLACMLLPASAPAQFSQQGAKLVGMGALDPAYQGWSVSLSGDGNTAIAGGFYDNGGAGAAWVYARSGALIFAGTPGYSNCHGKSVAALAAQYGGLYAASAALGFPTVQALQNAVQAFCDG